LEFSPGDLLILNFALAFIMFGVALEIKTNHFKKLLFNPKAAVVGVVSQFLLLPLFTFLLTIIFRKFLTPTIALGMILVAACPGGNISNFFTSLAKGNLALSVSLTAISTLGAVFITPLNFELWGTWFVNYYSHIDSSTLVKPLEIDGWQMFQTVFLILGIPLLTGIFFNERFPNITQKIALPIKRISLLIFAIIVAMALIKNFSHFLKAIEFIFLIVLVHNAVALAVGYYFSKINKLSIEDRRTVSIETGIQNSGLGLVLIFNPKIFPPELELGGMAIVAAWWGIWHIFTGFFMAGIWTRFSFGLRKTNK
jgi:BASS family bile acid:Na+ symporter